MLDTPNQTHPIQSPDDAPIFIIGTGRSGTTLLRQMLNAHPRIHITHEASFYSYARHAPAHTTATEWLERYFETYSFAWMRLDPQRVRRSLPRTLPMERVSEAYRVLMREKAALLGKPRYGEKNPLDTHNLAQILQDYKDPRIVFITRDPRPTVLSFNRMPFGTSSMLLNTLLCRTQFDHVKPYLDRMLEIRLEDLTADPRTTLAGVLRYIGEPWDDAVLDHVHNSRTDDVPPLPWFVGATREQPSRETSSGRDAADPAWIRIIEDLNRGTMERYGYARAKLAHEPTFWQKTAALLRDLPDVAVAAQRLLSYKGKLDRHFRGEERLDPQRGMEENVGLNPAAWRHYPGFQLPEVPRLLMARRD